MDLKQVAGLDLQDWRVIERLADASLAEVRQSKFHNLVNTDTLVCISRMSRNHIKSLIPPDEEDD